MSDQSDDKNKKGFAGFDAFSNDLSVYIPDDAGNADVPTPKQSSESDAQQSSEAEKVFQAPPQKKRAEGFWWIIIIGVIGGLWLFSQSDNKSSKRSSSYSSSQYSSGNTYSDTTTETMPTVGQNNVLGASEIRYCLSEKIRMDAIETAINKYSDNEINKFNAAVADYNSRCGSFRYRETTFSSVSRSVELNRSSLFNEGLAKVQVWRGTVGSKKNSTSVLIPTDTSILPSESVNSAENESNAKDPQALKNQEISSKSGLKISRIDQFGSPLPTTGGYVSDSKFIVTLHGKKIYEDDGSAYMNFEYYQRLNSEDVVVIETNSGGNACPSEYKLFAIRENSPPLIKDFGNCGAPEISTPANNQIKFSFYAGYGKRLVALYTDGQLKQETISLPLKEESNFSDIGFQYLAKYASKSDSESILLDKKVSGLLTSLLGKDFEALKDRLEAFYINTAGDYIVISGAIPHSFTIDEGYLAISLSRPIVYVGILETEFSKDYKFSQHYVRAYTNQATSDSVPPPSMTQWLKNIKDAKITWKYNQQEN